MAQIDPSGPFEVTFEDLPYATPDDETLLARVYRPVGGHGPFPALIDVHGGAWAFFDRTPEAIGLIGGSSGGHLALLAAIRPNAIEYDGTPYVGMRARPIDARVAFALPLWPIADPGARYRYLLERIAHPVEAQDPFFRPEHLKTGHDLFFGDLATMDRASVPGILAAGGAEALPPIWVAHPALDENVTPSMTEALVASYRAAGGSAECEIFPAVGHAFANFPTPAADGCIERMKAFITRQLRGDSR